MLYIINFKTYEEGLGENAIRLANAISEVSKKKNADIWAVPQFTDLKEVSRIVPALAQHIDAVSYGSHTGSVLPQSIVSSGSIGTLINHSEKRLELDEILCCINLAKSIGLKTICCAEDLDKVMKIAKFEPDCIAYEDPELIGSGRSVSQEKPETVARFVEILKEMDSKVIPLCGAGVSNREDVQKAKELGTKGVLVASAIVKAKNQKEALMNLIL